jgi:Fe-S-cluster-containing dehydrogenase component
LIAAPPEQSNLSNDISKLYRDKDKEIEFVYSKKVCMYCTSQCCVNVVPISTSDRMTVGLVCLWVNTGEE